MAKGKNKYSPQQPSPPAVSAVSIQRTPLDKLVPIWGASLDNASKVLQSFDRSLDIKIDQNWLRSICDRFEAENATELAKWIEQFADVCKEFVRFKEKLQEECTSRWDEANQLALASQNKELQLEKEKTEFDTIKAQQENDRTELEGELIKLNKTKSELLDLQRSLMLREENAAASFLKQNEQALQQLEEQKRELTKHHETQLQRIRDEKRSLDDEIIQSTRRLDQIKNSGTEAEAQHSRELEQREHEIQQARKELELAHIRLDRGWDDLKRSEALLEQRIAEEMEAERKSHMQSLEKMQLRRDKAWEQSEALKEQLADLKEFKQVLGERAPVDILEQLDRLRDENRILRSNLEQSDTAELQRENEYLRNSKADLERDLSTLRPELDESRRELSIKRVSATELEAVAREKRVLEQHKNTLAVHIDDLESRIAQLTNAQKTQTPFPAMSLMDSEREYRASIELEDVPDLKQFANELQHRIANAEQHVKLYYPIEDIRVLLGGLAMSQLHVFQGISGTGKTSLAKAFAKAMGGFCTDIAVQAGWRDRDDLLGHYNAFEKRFYEKDCLQALYKSQTPRWEDTCNIILLDEMNLSRPEQYFAEFLSALEKNNKNERLIGLSEIELPNAPIMLREGRKILVPENVWFIGTANHDETTNELADKTYDRAHVMTLPKQDDRFQIKNMAPTNYSYHSLRRAFSHAQAEGKEKITELMQKLTNDGFTELLGSRFELGWGNRFEKQALAFIPVMEACGATAGEALDHLLSTRVMRKGKVTGRYNVSTDAIREVKDALESFWVGANLDGTPSKSFDLLNSDINRLEDHN